MLSDNVDELSQKSPVQSEHATQKQSKISYTRDFLLSLSELDICKEIPSGFDTSLLSELEGSSNNTLEHQRNYGSLPPNRLEGSSNYSRGSTGRWVTRSSGSSEKDGDLACDRDSSKQDSGRHLVNQTRRVWQNPENDGLLGSGGFPISSGYAGASALKTRGSGQYQLSRSTEPYQPPQPYKAAHSWKDNTDSFNDETFGSSECSSEDRAEERKRRESFELMRKEQQKTLQEQQKQKSENQKGKLGSGITALLENSEDRKSPGDDYNLSKDSLANDSSRVSHIQIPASRPLVPPGFAGAPLEKKICAKSSTPLIPEAGSVFNENSLTLNASSKDGFNSAHVPSIQANENNVITSSDVEVFRHSVDFGNVSLEALGLLDTNEVWEDVMNKEEALGVANAVSHTSSTSGLDKLFGSVLAKDKSSSSNYIESQAVKSDEGRWSPSSSGSSKFAHMFRYEEDKKSVNESSSRDLLSLINIEGTVPTVSGNGGIVHNDPLPEFIASPATLSMIGIPELCCPSERLTVKSGVLTCEDLEQSIMTEVKEVSSTLERSMQGPQLDAKPEEQKVDADDHASQHLLSLLLRGTSTKENDALGITDNAVRDTETIRGGSGKTQTLEAFLGPAFMNELHSAEAPLSVKRGSSREIVNNDATQPQDFPWRVVDDSLLFLASNEYITNQRTHEGKLAASDHTGEAKRLTTSDHTGEAKQLTTSDHTGEAKRLTTRGPWVRNAVTEYSKLGDFGIEDSSTCIHLPDEDRLIKVGDSLDPIISEPSPFTNASKEEHVHEKTTPETLSDKLLAAILRGEERMSTHNIMEPPLMRGPYDAARTSDNPYNNINVYDRGPSQFPHMNNARPLFPQSGHYAHRHPLMRFMGPESIHHHPRHRFPENIIPQHALHDNRGPHSMMDRMPIQVNFPQRYPLQDFPRRGVSLSHQVNHMPSGYMPEMSNMHVFPLQQRQPNFDDFGLGMHGVGGGMGSSRPKAVEELMEMEMRANSKQSHPVVGGHIPGIYHPGVEMNFRYR